MAIVKGSLPEEDLKLVAETLQGALVDLVDVALVSKQIHWNIVGPRFRSIHLQLDKVVSMARKHSDTVAERAAAIGVTPDGRAATVAATSAFGAVPNGWIKDTDAVRIMVDGLASVIRQMRERVEVTADPDPVTQDVLIKVTAGLEKHSWMFQAENA